MAAGFSGGASKGGSGSQILGQIIGGFMQAAGQGLSGQALQRSAEAQSASFAANARIAEMNAISALETGEAAKRRRQRIGKARLASSATKFLKGGVVLSGSPLAVLGDEAVNEALAAEDFLHEGKIKANQARNQASLQRFYSEQASQKASRISSDTSFRVGSTLLGTGIKAFR